MSKIKWEVSYEGIISKLKKRSWLWQLFHRWDYPWKTITQYTPKKEYSKIEQKKINKLLYLERDLDVKDLAIIVNTIRPNTFKESVEEVTTSKYYVNATTKEDINLLKSSK